MPHFVDIEFIALDQAAAAAGTLVVFTSTDMAMGSKAAALTEPASASLKRAAEAAKFKGKAGSTLDLLAPAALSADRLIVVGSAPDKEATGTAS